MQIIANNDVIELVLKIGPRHQIKAHPWPLHALGGSIWAREAGDDP